MAIVELFPVPVEPTQMMQVPALSSSSGGTTGGKLTRAVRRNLKVSSHYSRLHLVAPLVAS